MKKYRFMFKVMGLIVGLGMTFPITAHASADRSLYLKALRLAKTDQRDFSYMQYRSILHDYPDSRYTPQALFAVGEYYFMNAEYKEAQEHFVRYLTMMKNQEDRIFVLIYLMETSRLNGDKHQAEEYEKEALGLRQQTFLFKENIVQVYLSPLLREHKAVYEIDGISFYVEGTLFAKINY